MSNLSSVPIEGLSNPQLHVLAGLTAGLTVAEMAGHANVSRQTIYNWQEQPKFANALTIGKQLHADDVRDQMLVLSRKALKRLETIIDDPKSPPSVALKASLAVLNRPQFPEQGWSLPANVNTPRQERIHDMQLAIEIDMKQAELDDLKRKLMMAKIKAEAQAEAAAKAKAAAKPVGQNLTPSQPVQPQPAGQNLTPQCASHDLLARYGAASVSESVSDHQRRSV